MMQPCCVHNGLMKSVCVDGFWHGQVANSNSACCRSVKVISLDILRTPESFVGHKHTLSLTHTRSTQEANTDTDTDTHTHTETRQELDHVSDPVRTESLQSKTRLSCHRRGVHLEVRIRIQVKNIENKERDQNLVEIDNQPAFWGLLDPNAGPLMLTATF